MSLLVALLLAAVQADGATTWISTFTGSARADYAVGPSTVSGTAEILPEGAIRFAADTWLEVRAGPGVLPREAGTIEFRLRPEWNAPPAGAVPILRRGDAAIAVEPDGRLRATGFAGRGAESPAREWARGEWFDIAISWGPAGLFVLVDGAEGARAAGRAALPAPGEGLTFGGGAFSIDDLRISDAARWPSPDPPLPSAPRPPAVEPESPAGTAALPRLASPPEGLVLAPKHYSVPLSPDAPLPPPGPVRVSIARGRTEPATILVAAGVRVEGLTIAASAPGVAVAVLSTDGTPLPAPLSLDAAECLEVWLEISVPADAAPGFRRGEVRFSAVGADAALPIEVEVLPFTLPPERGKRLATVVAAGSRLVEPDQLALDFAWKATFGFDAAMVDVAGGALARTRAVAAAAGFTGTVEPLEGFDAGAWLERDWRGADGLRLWSGLELEAHGKEGLLLHPCPLTFRKRALFRAGLDDGRTLRLLSMLAEGKALEWPEAAARARERVRETLAEVRSEHPDGPALDGLRRRLAESIRELTEPGSLRIAARQPDGTPLSYVLVTATGESGAPVVGLYDYRVDLDPTGHGEVAVVPAGCYSVRLHTEREFRAETGFDPVWVGTAEVRPGEATTVDATLAASGRLRVTAPEAARIGLLDGGGRPVSATFWRGESGGFTTEMFRLTPGFLSCPLPPGSYRVRLTRTQATLAEAEVEIRAGEVTDVALTPRR